MTTERNYTQAWITVVLLSVLYAFSFVDQFVLVLLIEPIGREMGVTQIQIGMLFGLGFTIVYAIGALPVGNLVDRYDRRLIITGGVVLWSVMTIAAAFAPNFATLIVTRAGLALGEAVIAPAAVSLIGDMFPPDRRSMPVAVFSATAATMAKGAIAVGGLAFALAGSLAVPGSIWTDIGLVSWRLTFIVVGVPSLMFGLVFFLAVSEPKRVLNADGSLPTFVDFAAFWKFLSGRWSFFLPYYLAVALGCTFLFGEIVWLPTVISRTHGVSISEASYWLGTVGVVAASTGSFFWPWLASYREKRGDERGIMFSLCAAFGVGLFAMGFAPLSTSLTLLLLGMSVATFCLASLVSLNPLVLQKYGPPLMRGRLTALTLWAYNLLGFTIGPAVAPMIASAWPNSPFALGYAISVLGFVCGIGSFALFLVGRSTSEQTAERDHFVSAMPQSPTVSG